MSQDHQEILLGLITDQRDKVRHWKFCHYDAARRYMRIDLLMGSISIILATVILWSALYTYNRPDVDILIQGILALFSVAQGVLLTLQLYIQPNAQAKGHTNAAERLGALGRNWAAVETRVKLGEDVDISYIEEIMSRQDAISRDSNPIPPGILKRNGVRPK